MCKTGKMVKQEDGYMASVLKTLKSGESREFPLSSVNVDSWRTIASRENRKVGLRMYSVIKCAKLGIMVVKHNAYE